MFLFALFLIFRILGTILPNYFPFPVTTFSSVSSENPEILTMSTLGQKAISLGGLYSAVEDKFLPGMSMCSADLISQQKYVIHHPKQKSKWTSAQTLAEKVDMMKFDVSGTVSIVFEIAKVAEASGSFKYLTAKKVTMKILEISICKLPF